MVYDPNQGQQQYEVNRGNGGPGGYFQQQSSQQYGPAPQGYGYYGQPPPQGYGYGYGPGQPPNGGYYERDRGSGGSGICAGLMAGLACCCCLDCLF